MADSEPIQGQSTGLGGAPGVIALRLLGGLSIVCPARGQIAITSKRGQAFLTHLALSPDLRCPRDKMAAMLWEDRGDEQARHSLRQSILTLKRALHHDDGAAVLLTDGDGLALDETTLSIDVLAFERLAESAERADLERAAALYGGDLADGLAIASASFETWLEAERRRLRALAETTLARLAALQAEAGDTEAATRTAQRLLALDPAREDAHRLLMRIFARSGRRSAALRQYRLCAAALRQELDADPEPETIALHAELRDLSDKRDASDERNLSDDTVAAPDIAQVSGSAPAAASALGAAATTPPRRGIAPWWLFGALAVLIVVAGGAYWGLAAPGADFDTARTDRFAFPLPSKPSIAILPFENRTGDPANDGFAEGISEEITAALSLASSMFVIASSSTRVYGGQAPAPSRVAEALGVRHVVAGSVQQSGGRMRIAAQLVDAVRGQELWAHTYEREATEIFALQDDIALEIVTALQVEMTEGLQARMSLVHGTRNLRAWILAGQGLRLLGELSRPATARARMIYAGAIELDPSYPGAWGGLAWSHLLDARFGWAESRAESFRTALDLAEKTLRLDPSRPRTHALLGNLALLAGDHDQAVAHGEKAVQLSPSGADVTALLGITLTYTGASERSITLLTQAMRLGPAYPAYYRWSLGRAYRLSERYGDAIDALGHGLSEAPAALAPRVELALAYSLAGDAARARATAAEVIAIEPAFSAAAWVSSPPYADPADGARELALLREAGLPD